MGWTTYYYCCPICGRMEMASMKAALQERLLAHVTAHTTDLMGLPASQKNRLMKRIDEACPQHTRL